MNLSRIGTTLIQITNIVLLLRESTADIRKFAAWRIDKKDPEEVLKGLEIESMNFEDSIKLFEHPLETGAVITDHMIIDPNQVSLRAYISNDDTQTLKELEYLHLNGIPLKIRVQNKVLDRVIIKDKPFAVDGTHFDKSSFSITFREEQEVNPVYVAMSSKEVRKASNSSRVNSGVKQVQTTSKKESWFIQGGLKSPFKRRK